MQRQQNAKTTKCQPSRRTFLSFYADPRLDTPSLQPRILTIPTIASPPELELAE